MPKKLQCLNGAQLKWIAMVSMLIDHLDKGIVVNLICVKNYSPAWLEMLSMIMGILGRVAFPIFLFLLVEGFFHTRSRLRYLGYLTLFALLSEIPYDMFESGMYWDMGGQNMFFTLALALLVIWAIDSVRRKLKSRWWIAATVPIAFAGCALAALLGLDYTYYGIIIPVIFYLARERRAVASVLGYLTILKEIWSFTGFVCVNLYNGERGRINKWIGYWFYPVHLLIIGLVRMFLLKA